jgi:hypothetical protein
MPGTVALTAIGYTLALALSVLTLGLATGFVHFFVTVWSTTLTRRETAVTQPTVGEPVAAD